MRTETMYRKSEFATTPEQREYNRAVTQLEVTGLTRPQGHRHIAQEARRRHCSQQAVAIEILAAK